MSSVESGLLITWSLVCAGISLAAAIFVVRRYAHPDVHWSVKATTVVCWFFGFSVIWMIAIDCNPTARVGMRTLWKITFWAIQIGTWLWCGLQQDYFDAGEFDTKGKIKYSIIINLKILGAAGAVGIVFLVYIAIVNEFSSDDLVGFVVALANTIGLTLLICLLGHGLVEVPRKFWEEASYQIRMKHYLYKLKQVDVDWDQCKEEMANVCTLVKKALEKIKKDDEYYPQFLIVEGNVPDAAELKAYGVKVGSATIDSDDKLYERLGDCSVPDLQLLVDINFRARRATAELRRVRLVYDMTIDKAIKCEEQLNEMLLTPPPDINSRETLTVENVQWYFQNKYGRRMLLMRAGALLCGLMSIFVVWCEVTMFSSTSLSIFGAWLKPSLLAHNAVAVQIIATLPITYICGCAFFSAFRLRIGKFYHLHDEQQTDFNSLLYNAQLMLRLVVGVGYNYMQILNIKQSGFLDIMGTMNVVPLFGNAFVLYFPILLAFFCVATTMNWWSLVARCLGSKTFSGNESHSDENMQEGLQLLETAKRKRAERRNGGGEDPEANDGILGAALSKTRGMLQAFGIVRDDSGAGGHAITTHIAPADAPVAHAKSASGGAAAPGSLSAPAHGAKASSEAAPAAPEHGSKWDFGFNLGGSDKSSGGDDSSSGSGGGGEKKGFSFF